MSKFRMPKLPVGMVTPNQALHRTLDPSLIFAAAKTVDASSVVELRHYALKCFRKRYAVTRLTQWEIMEVA